MPWRVWGSTPAAVSVNQLPETEADSGGTGAGETPERPEPQQKRAETGETDRNGVLFVFVFLFSPTIFRSTIFRWSRKHSIEMDI